MSQIIPQDRLDQILKNNDLAKLISETDPPLSDGRFICPWCHDSRAFNVSSKYQTYHCFACGQGGGVIRWMMDRRAMGFHRAVQTLEATIA